MRTRNPDLESHWRERVEAWRASGQSAARFAAEHDLSASSLLRWSSLLARRAPARTSAAPAFVPVVRAQPLAARELLIEVGVARVRVAAGFDPELLASVVRAIGGAT